MSRSQRHAREFRGVDSDGGRPLYAGKPTIAGTKTNGSTLTGTNTTFSGMGTITVTRRWFRDATPIPNAVNATYVLTSADVGHKITFRNYGESLHGKNYVDSDPTVVIT